MKPFLSLAFVGCLAVCLTTRPSFCSPRQAGASAGLPASEIVVSLADLENAVVRAASAALLRPEVATAALEQFKVENSRRLVHSAELRGTFLEILYEIGVAYPQARNFLTSLRAELGSPAPAVDTGLVVRRVDLRDQTLFKIGRGVTPPRVIEEPLPLYTKPARNAAIEGVVLVRCIVLADGTVANLAVERGLGYGRDGSAMLTIQAR